MRTMRITLALTAFIFGTVQMTAQEYPIGGGNITDCGGFLVDNGLSANDYGPNENSTATICHDGTDDPIVNLYFASFNLGTGDQLIIYNGPDTSSPVIGTYTGNDLQGQDIYSENPQGCLTLTFTSDGDSSVGSFGAEISCGLPCERPVPVVSTDQLDSNPVRLCPGEDITFDASASVFAEGTALASFTWDFDDGTTDNASWPQVTHSFDEPGAYIVQLALTDDNECNSGQLIDLLIYVATEPDMTAIADDYQVCIGQEVNLTGIAEPVTWSALPDADFGGALFIPDDQSQCFSSELVFGGFEPGATIQNETDLESFFINFEHSFMGDLVISFICPNGQSLVVHEQGGSSTFLGEPVDNDLNPTAEGVGYDYWWSPSATNGTWAENSGGTLPSGTYESVQPFSDLIGCPLNGAWEVEVCDLWASDNGFIFDWSVQFADYLYPDLISFTPSIGAGCDSTFWSGPFIANNGGNCDNVSIVPTQAGDFVYTYTAYDDHGCVYVNEISINAFPGPIPNAGPDGAFCGSPVQLSGTVTNPVSGVSYNYSWSPGSGLSNPNTANPTVNSMSQTTDFILSVQPSDDPQCLVTDTLTLFIPLTPPNIPIDSLEWCAGGNTTLPLPTGGEGWDYTWFFSETLEGTPEVIQTEDVGHQASNGGYYYVTYAEPVCGFTGEASYFVELQACQVVIPNVFTPNGDGINDQLVIAGLEDFPRSTIRVYNRWGALLYESDNYKNNWSPRDLAEGTYYFILGVRKNTGEFEYYESHLTLLRK